MFEKKDVIFSESLGVCQVHEIAKLSAKNGEQVLYYGLRSVADKKKVAYIPVEHHSVLLRPLVSYEEALKVMDDYKKQQEDTGSAYQENHQENHQDDVANKVQDVDREKRQEGEQNEEQDSAQENTAVMKISELEKEEAEYVISHHDTKSKS